MTKHYPLTPEERRRLYREFFNTYDTDHWLHKIRTWDVLLDNASDFIDEFGDEDLQASGVSSFEHTIKSEIVFTFYHISESLFMLMAACGSHLPWISMKHLWISDLEDFYEEEVEGGGDPEKLENTFYPDMREPEEHEGTMEDSIDFIDEYLQRMGERFFNREIYNEYKHGLRLSTGEAEFRIAPEIDDQNGETGESVLRRGGLAHTYLDTEELDLNRDGEWFQIYQVLSGFDYQLFLNMCHINYLLIDQIIRSRQQAIETEVGDERVEVNSFHNYDVDEIFDYDYELDWEFRVSYQIGNEVVEFDY